MRLLCQYIALRANGLLALASLPRIDRARKELLHFHLGEIRTDDYPFLRVRIAAMTSSHGVKLTSPRSIA